MVDNYLPWIQDHILAIVAVMITLVLMYHYLLEKDTGVKLSKRYRNSIFEAQSKVFLNATQYLISGNRDLAIREFLSAVDINRETVDTYFALGGLFRSNGETEKAISIHRSLIARENISEVDRLRALKELAVDFDKGGFVDKAIETYKDVLKINRDQEEVIQAMCRIFEDIEDWDQAYNYRIMLSKVGQVNQSETISHILVQKARVQFEKGDLSGCHEDLEQALRFAPSVSARILKLQLYLSQGDMEEAKNLLLELLKEQPIYASFIFESLERRKKVLDETYQTRSKILTQYFLELDDKDLLNSQSVVLTKVRLLKKAGDLEGPFQIMQAFLQQRPDASEVMKTEYVKILIQMDRKDEAIEQTKGLLENLSKTLTKHYCSNCGFNSDEIFWRCPQCREWETIKFRFKV